MGSDPTDDPVHFGSRESHRPPELRLELSVPGDDTESPRLSVTLDTTIVADPPTFTPAGVTTNQDVAVLEDPHGRRTQFVADELIISTNDTSELTRILADWNGQLLHSTDPAEPSLAGDVQTHLIKIDPASVTPGALVPLLHEIDARHRGAHRISSALGMAAFAASAAEYLRGTRVSLNFLGSEAAEAISFDSMAAKSVIEGTDLTGHGRNALQWPSFQSPLPGVADPWRMGVGDAWRALYYSGKLNMSQIRVAVVDTGFALDFLRNDAPPFISSGPEYSCVDRSCPGRDPKAWHGTWVTEVGFGLPDNGFGSAGPGGPVADLRLVSAFLDAHGLTGSMRAARRTNPKIMTVSIGGNVPAISFFLIEPQEDLTDDIRSDGTLLFAAAGNDGDYVDDEDCFIWCWESRWYWPCENDGVTCVGGLQLTSDARAPSSNHGQQVDIFGPYTGFAAGPSVISDGADFSGDAFTMHGGTSYASPFVAGVAALAWAANPSAKAGDVASLLYENAVDSADRRITVIVNARSTVEGALGYPGGYPPRVRIATPGEGDELSPGFHNFFGDVSTYDGSPASIGWSSNVEGPLGGGSPASVDLFTLGEHTITATAGNAYGAGADAVDITVVQAAPIVEITSPAFDGTIINPALPFNFQARVTNDFFFPCESIVWSGDVEAPSGVYTGCSVSLVLTRPGPGVVRATATSWLGQVGVAERLFVAGQASSEVQVRLTSPLPADASGIAFADFNDLLALAAEVSNPTGMPYTIGWFFSSRTTVIAVGAAPVVSWAPQGTLPFRCGGYVGTLTVVVFTEAGPASADSVTIRLVDSTC